MKLSETVEWSLHACTTLCFLPPDKALPARKLAEFHGVRPAYLAKALAQLASAGILESLNGRSGGYRLLRPASEVTILDILDAVEPKSALFVCTEIRKQGPCSTNPAKYHPRCNIARVMDEAEEAWRDVLRQTTLDALSRKTMVESPDEVTGSAIVWLKNETNSRS